MKTFALLCGPLPFARPFAKPKRQKEREKEKERHSMEEKEEHHRSGFFFFFFVLIFFSFNFFSGVSDRHRQRGHFQAHLRPLFSLRRYVSSFFFHFQKKNKQTKEWPLFCFVFCLAMADVSQYAHLVFRAFDVNHSGVINFEVRPENPVKTR